MVLALLSALSILGALHQATKTHDTRALQQRGVTTSATVLRSSYDPDGGDPNGWTTDTVQFRDTQGRNNQADVGHHGDNHVEQGTRTPPIIYDPHHPTVAVSAQEYANSTPALDLTAAVAITAVLVISALATLLSAFELSKSDTKSNDDRPAGQQSHRGRCPSARVSRGPCAQHVGLLNWRRRCSSRSGTGERIAAMADVVYRDARGRLIKLVGAVTGEQLRTPVPATSAYPPTGDAPQKSLDATNPTEH